MGKEWVGGCFCAVQQGRVKKHEMHLRTAAQLKHALADVLPVLGL